MPRQVHSPVTAYVHDNYSAVVAPGASKSLHAKTVSLLIDNMDSSINIYVSFDSGTTWKTIRANQSMSFDIAPDLRSYYVKSASGTPSVETLQGYTT